MNSEVAAYQAKELAAMVRAVQTGQNVAHVDVWNQFVALANSPSETPADALALIGIARLLIQSNMESLDLDPESNEHFSMSCALALMNKATLTLEMVTGENETAFTGRGPAVN